MLDIRRISLTHAVRNRYFILSDMLLIMAIPVMALFILSDGAIDAAFWGWPMAAAIELFAAVKFSIFYAFGIYRRYWEKAGIDDMIKLTVALAFACLIQFLVFFFLHNTPPMNRILGGFPHMFPIVDGLLAMGFIGISRFSLRILTRINERLEFSKNSKNGNTLIIGAGEAGVTIVEELQRYPQKGIVPFAFIDDDPAKMGMRIRGIEVVGNRDAIPAIAKEFGIQKALIVMPTVPGLIVREIHTICKKANIETLTVPGLFEIADGKVTVDYIKKIDVEDLLRRDSIITDIKKVTSFLKGKKVLITGAGGSIGSELVRQIYNCYPSEMILVGHGENSIFDIEQELRNRHFSHGGGAVATKVACKIADIRFKDRLRFIFESFQPDVVFHAAAHKHVPLMEDNPSEAITNNVLGTKNLAETAVEFGVKNFILISTDKAVNPTSVMGATKRLAEMIVHNFANETGYHYSAVRFGNVLGSRGSVLHTFKKQILRGGPITVTHPDITRYFITIPEAVQLVLQASVLGTGGEVFVLDMGEPVKIVDLAKDVITLSGLELEKDIEIQFTGLRTGEKLYEELFIDKENFTRTGHGKIFIADNSSRHIPENFLPRLCQLIEEGKNNNYEQIIHRLMDLIPEYTPDSLHTERILSTET